MGEILLETEQAEKASAEELLPKENAAEQTAICAEKVVPDRQTENADHPAEGCGGVKAVPEKARNITTGIHIDVGGSDELCGVEAAFRRANPNIRF